MSAVVAGPATNMRSFTIHDVRTIAESFKNMWSYHGSRNEKSRVISFPSKPGTTRINVYYKTRIVGTSLNHHELEKERSVDLFKTLQ